MCNSLALTIYFFQHSPEAAILDFIQLCKMPNLLKIPLSRILCQGIKSMEKLWTLPNSRFQVNRTIYIYHTKTPGSRSTGLYIYITPKPQVPGQPDYIYISHQNSRFQVNRTIYIYHTKTPGSRSDCVPTNLVGRWIF